MSQTGGGFADESRPESDASLRLSASPDAVTPDSAAAADTTRQKLLDAAERVFAEKGYDAAGVREITAAAGANLAAVNYHFGSKQGLYDAVFRRMLDHLREQRLAAIAAVAEQAAAAQDIELALRAFGLAFLKPLMDPHRGRLMMQLFMRELTASHLPPRLMVERMIGPIQHAMSEVMQRACPGLSAADAALCLHSLVGQLLQVVQMQRMQQAEQVSAEAGLEPSPAMEHIVRFSAAGVRACAAAPRPPQG